MKKKQKKGHFTLTLKKEGANDIVIESCPEKMKLSILSLYLAVSSGCPAMDVKPIDWKGTGIIFGTFYGGLALLGILSKAPALAVFVFLIFFGFNVVYTRNYFFNYVKGKLEEGYLPETEEQKEILQRAGLHFLMNESTGRKAPFSSDESKPRSAVSIASELEKLAELKAKGILSDEEFTEQKKKLLSGGL